MNKTLIFICSLILFHIIGKAQDMDYVKKKVNDLCSEKFSGRGYVNDGVNKAADYLVKEFKSLKLKPINGSYIQPYAFSVNTHPSHIDCTIDNESRKVGHDYIINAGSPSIAGKYQLLHFNWTDSLEKNLLAKKIEKGFENDEALVLRNSSERKSHILDSLETKQHFPALIIYTEEKKLTHTISTDVDKIPSMTIFDSLIFNKEQIEINVTNQFIDEFVCNNIQGLITGKSDDSLIVFTAHYDHLGLQDNALFPGASDNASGVSMILSLAKYYGKHKPKYNTVFILFSGEEAGLLGSDFYTSYPTINLSKIKMLINIDIMGNAEKGITVVNGELHKEKFDLLTSINTSKKYIPAVNIRGQAANSDHYHFTQKGVPSFFIYAMGGQGYYHDVLDKAEALQFTNYENVFKLLLNFVEKL